MVFRVFIAGGRHPIRDAALRAKLLANRMPDVELLTAGGAGVPMLVASDVTVKELTCTALVPEYGRFPGAKVVVWAPEFVPTDNEPGVRRILGGGRRGARCMSSKGSWVHVFSGENASKLKAGRRAEASEAVEPGAGGAGRV